MASESLPAVRQAEPELTPFEVIERVITSGDLSKMDAPARVAFYWRTCESLGLNPLTRPFEYINLSGKLTMYPKRDATDQLRRIHHVSIDRLDHAVADDILTVTAYGHTPDGRQDSDIGSVNLKGLSGEARANATKKAVTQAKRRLTLSLVGLGFLDESEITDAGGQAVDVDPETGEIRQPAPKPSLLEAVQAQRDRMARPAAPEAAVSPAASAPPDDAEEGEFTPMPDIAAAEPAPGMTADEFNRRAKEARLGKTAFAAACERVIPDVSDLTSVTDEQRYLLAVDLGWIEEGA